MEEVRRIQMLAMEEERKYQMQKKMDEEDRLAMEEVKRMQEMAMEEERRF